MKSQDPSTLLFAEEVLNGEKFEIDEAGRTFHL